MSPTRNNNMVYGSLALGALCAILCVAIVAQAQYNTFDSDSNSGKLTLKSDWIYQWALLMNLKPIWST